MASPLYLTSPLRGDVLGTDSARAADTNPEKLEVVTDLVVRRKTRGNGLNDQTQVLQECLHEPPAVAVQMHALEVGVVTAAVAWALLDNGIGLNLAATGTAYS